MARRPRVPTRLTGVVAIALAGAALPSQTASAERLVWQLSDVEFADGGTAEGHLVYDSETNEISNFRVSIAGGDASTFPSFTYTPGNSSARTNAGQAPGGEAAWVIEGPESLAHADRRREFRFTPMETPTGASESIGLFGFFGEGTLGAEECYACTPHRGLVDGGSLVLLGASYHHEGMGLLPVTLWITDNVTIEQTTFLVGGLTSGWASGKLVGVLNPVLQVEMLSFQIVDGASHSEMLGVGGIPVQVDIDPGVTFTYLDIAEEVLPPGDPRNFTSGSIDALDDFRGELEVLGEVVEFDVPPTAFAAGDLRNDGETPFGHLISPDDLAIVSTNEASMAMLMPREEVFRTTIQGLTVRLLIDGVDFGEPDLHFSTVPEPSGALLGGAAVLALTVLRRSASITPGSDG